MTQSIDTVCERHAISIAKGCIKVDTRLPRLSGTRHARSREWTRQPIPLPEGASENNVKLIFASARPHGIDVIVDWKVQDTPRAWLWRLSPVRLRAVKEITYVRPTPRGAAARPSVENQVFGDFRAFPEPSHGAVGGRVLLEIDEIDGMTKAKLDLDPNNWGPAGDSKFDDTFDLFVSYKACDIEKTPCLAMVEAAKSRHLKVWFAPERLPAQPKFSGPIRRAIRKSRAYLIIWSDNSDQHLPGEFENEPPDSEPGASENFIPSHVGGVMKMNQLWEASYIISPPDSDFDPDKLGRIWVFDARSPENREIPLDQAFKGAFSKMDIDRDVLMELNMGRTDPNAIIQAIDTRLQRR